MSPSTPDMVRYDGNKGTITAQQDSGEPRGTLIDTLIGGGIGVRYVRLNDQSGFLATQDFRIFTSLGYLNPDYNPPADSDKPDFLVQQKLNPTATKKQWETKESYRTTGASFDPNTGKLKVSIKTIEENPLEYTIIATLSNGVTQQESEPVILDPIKEAMVNANRDK